MIAYKKSSISLLFFVVFGGFCSLRLSAEAENANFTTEAISPQPLVTGKKFFVQSLHLHVLLNEFRDFIAQQVLLDQPDEKKKEILLSLALVEEAIKKIHEIIEAFNSELFYSQDNRYKSLEILYKFVNTYNFLSDVGQVEPRHLRMLRVKLEEFDEQVNDYCLREKKFLTAQEIEVFNKITQLNQILLKHLLKDKYLCLDLAHKLADRLFHRPWEVVCEHPWATLGVLVGSGIAAYLFWDLYYVPYVQLKNRNEHFDVVQFKVRRQYGQTCGVHGAYNLMCFIRGQNDEQISALLANSASFNEALAVCKRVNGDVDNLHGAQVQQLLDSYDVPADARANLMIIESTPNNNILGALSHMDQDVLAATAADGVHSIVNIPDAPRRFNAGQTQYFLVNNNGHWRPFSFTRDANARGGVRILTAESYHNNNVTNSSIISSICRFLTGRAPAHSTSK